MADGRKHVIRGAFVVWVACWLYVFFVLPFQKNLSTALSLAVVLLLAISSFVFFLTAAKAKGYSYIIGIGLAMLNILGAAVLAFLPNKLAPSPQKGRFRKLMCVYLAVGVFIWFCVSYAGLAKVDPYFVPFPVLPSATAGFIAAAIAWVVPWPAILSGDPFPPMPEGFRRIALLAVITGSLVWWTYVVVAFEWSRSHRAVSVFLLFTGPVVLLLTVTIVTRLITWIHAGFQKPGKG